MTQAIYIRIDETLLKKFDEVAERMGYMRSEAIREAMRRFILSTEGAEETKKIRGLVKSKLNLKELEEAFMVSR
ncbi:MAG: CopG family ribbon-helix-helix protein [Candidatus Bathyarchaeia archaeon]